MSFATLQVKVSLWEKRLFLTVILENPNLCNPQRMVLVETDLSRCSFSSALVLPAMVL